MRLRVLSILVAACLVAAPAWADYQVRGRFLYRDREWGPSGFTGATTDLPIRLAAVQVVDWNNSSNVLATGATDASGNFVINVTESQVRDVYVRVLSQAAPPSDFEARVLVTGTGALYALASPEYPAHSPSADIDFTATPLVAVPGASHPSLGEAFNILDQALDAFDFIASIHGGRPTRLLTLYWSKGSTDGTYYVHGDASIHLYGTSSDSDGYDDTVILHEIGHYTEYNLASSDNPGGTHALSGYYALPLTWSEGWSTFFACMVRQWRGLPRSDLYIDTDGVQSAFISYSVENPAVGAPGANNEVTVNALLWDVVDTPGSSDASLGADDDSLALADGPGDSWDVMENYIATASSISLEDFWDGWFQQGKGHQADMEAIFGARKVEYFADLFESDATTVLAKTVVANSPATHRTTYPAGDEDWFLIGVVGGAAYVFQTQTLWSGADTRLDLYAANGTTLLASNDDVALGNPASRIEHTPAASGLVYLRCKRKIDTHTYGSYDLVVTGPPVPVEVSDVHLAALPEGIRIEWRAERDGSFSHFEVERAPDATGPWEVLGAVEPGAGAGTAAVYEYIDRSVDPGRTYAYRLVGVESNGERSAFGPFVIEAAAPARFALQSPYPTPFNPTTTIAFELPRAASAWLRVYGVDGRIVRTLVAGAQIPAGRHQVRWDGRDDFGAAVASGVYWFRLESDGEHQTRKGVLVR